MSKSSEREWKLLISKFLWNAIRMFKLFIEEIASYKGEDSSVCSWDTFWMNFDHRQRIFWSQTITIEPSTANADQNHTAQPRCKPHWNHSIPKYIPKPTINMKLRVEREPEVKNYKSRAGKFLFLRHKLYESWTISNGIRWTSTRSFDSEMANCSDIIHSDSISFHFIPILSLFRSPHSSVSLRSDQTPIP
jgi:hypothetical protein